MSDEDKKIINDLTNEMMKVSESNPDVMTYMVSLMKSYEKLEQENKELKKDLEYVLNQVLGAFERNDCIDWNFTDIREKYNFKGDK